MIATCMTDCGSVGSRLWPVNPLVLPGTARTMRRMEKITGRADDMIILRGVNLFPTQVEELILRIPALSPHFQLRLTRPGRMDAMTVHVERRPDAPRPTPRLQAPSCPP